MDNMLERLKGGLIVSLLCRGGFQCGDGRAGDDGVRGEELYCRRRQSNTHQLRERGRR